jgi:hypothetical protein
MSVADTILKDMPQELQSLTLLELRLLKKVVATALEVFHEQSFNILSPHEQDIVRALREGGWVELQPLDPEDPQWRNTRYVVHTQKGMALLEEMTPEHERTP